MSTKKVAKGEYVQTDTGNKVSRRAQISGTTNIILGGKTVIQADVVIRGDLQKTLRSAEEGGGSGPPTGVAIATGRYCFFSRGCVLKPPGKLYKGTFSHTTLRIAEHVFVGPNSVVEAALIGNHVHIGANCVIGKFAILKDYVRVLDGTVVPPYTVVPPLSVVGGRPGRVVAEIQEGEVEGMDLREVYRSVGN